MPEIKQSTVDLLRPLAIPLDDTIDTVIERLVRYYREHNDEEGAAAPKPRPPGLINFQPGSPPDLRHTKLFKAVFATKEIDNPNWNDLMRTAHEFGFHAVDRSLDKLRSISSANIVKGQKTDDGYSPLGSLGFSLQGVAANDAFRIVFGLAKKLSVPLEVIFDWRDKEGALHPGETGRLAWKP